MKNCPDERRDPFSGHYLEDWLPGLVSVVKITMVRIGLFQLWDPFQMALKMAEILGGDPLIGREILKICRD